MQGNSEQLTSYLEGSKIRFVVPVYQRKYEWKKENCYQLYKDLLRVIKEDKPSHFFGSIVASVVPNKGIMEYHIIDGQQRITTLMLIFLAVYHLLDEGKLVSEDENLKDEIYETYLVAKFKKGDDRYRLVPVETDREAYHKLFGPEEDYDRSSNLWLNYDYFYTLFSQLNDGVTVDELYAAINKLEIINIILEKDDNAQMIFESLNSTGLALEESDKIRNYVLMGLDTEKQYEYYREYWKKIEELTMNHVSEFIRDYLSIKLQSIPNISNVYPVFKEYVQDSQIPVSAVLDDLKKYARYYNVLLTCHSDTALKELDDCLYRINRLEITVTRPFFMEVLRLHHEGKLKSEDVLYIFVTTEIYLFRRNICDVPTNALGKIFVTIGREVFRYENNTDNFADKYAYALESRKESGRFPTDEEFSAALANKQVYLMRGRYKAYMFERFENYGTVEMKDVYTLLDNNIYTIEHIMPQHLNSDWQEVLGNNYEQIHEEWLHKLANLTLTGYNPSLSNKSFAEKRDAEEFGYKNSGIRMNQKIALLEKWDEDELTERSRYMVDRALTIWSYPETAFVPKEKEYDSCTLDDEDIELTGRELVKFSYKNAEMPVTTWSDMIISMVEQLHQQDKSVLTEIAYGFNKDAELSKYFSNNPSKLRNPVQIDNNIFFEKNSSTAYKVIILRRLFMLYHADPMDLVFYLKDVESANNINSKRHEMRKEYWTYALPLIQQANYLPGSVSFDKNMPTTLNETPGYFGIGGLHISCYADYEYTGVTFWISRSNAEENKKAFDLLYEHKNEIEQAIGAPLKWYRLDSKKASCIDYARGDLTVMRKDDWEKMAQVHMEWSSKFNEVLVPYVDELFGGKTAEQKLKRKQVVRAIDKWSAKNPGFMVDWPNSNLAYIRCRTRFMDEYLPDTPDHLSGWNTANHYYYEVRNNNGNELYLQLAFSLKDLTVDQRAIVESICEDSPIKWASSDQQWIVPFKSAKYPLDSTDYTNTVKSAMDGCLKEMRAFEESIVM